MKTLLKWPGGKARELKFILPHIPDSIENYEPFLGGGAVYFNLNTVKKSCYVNDMSDELINFYLLIKEQNNSFFENLNMLNNSWDLLTKFYINEETKLALLYEDFYNGNKLEIDLNDYINTISSKLSSKVEHTKLRQSILETEIKKSLINKFKRTKSLEIKKGRLPIEDIHKIFLSALKSAYTLL